MKTTRDLGLRSLAIIFAAAISLSAASAKTWVDSTGKNKIEAEFVSLADGKVTLESPNGRLIVLPLKRLSADDQAFAKAQARESKAPVESSGAMKTTATAKIQKWKNHADLKVEIDLIGGLAATAYSVGPVKADPIRVGGKQIEPEKPFGRGGFEVITRDKRFGNDHPENGVRVKIEYEVPRATESVGKVAGTVKVLGGGTAKEVVLRDLLTRPEGAIKDPVLAAKGLKVDFKLKPLDTGGLQLEVSMASGTESFVRLELVGADDKPLLEGVGSGSYSKGKTMVYLVTAAKDLLKSATLKLHFRDGAKEIEIPFTVDSVKVAK